MENGLEIIGFVVSDTVGQALMWLVVFGGGVGVVGTVQWLRERGLHRRRMKELDKALARLDRRTGSRVG